MKKITSIAKNKHFLKKCMERLWTSVSISNGSTEEFSRQSYCKNWFSNRVFYVTIADADIESLHSLHTLFDKYLDHMEIWTKSYGPNYTKFCAFSQKMVNHFCQSVDAILEDVSMTETIVWCWTISLNTIF